MGYRSDVGLCLTEAGKKILDARLADLEPEADKTRYIHELLNIFRDKREDQDSGDVAWLWEELKWYDDHDDVIFIETLLNDLDEEDYLFIRVGESDDDTEIRGSFWENPFDMRLLRGVAFG
jgi:hypothetical protein